MLFFTINQMLELLESNMVANKSLNGETQVFIDNDQLQIGDFSQALVYRSLLNKKSYDEHLTILEEKRRMVLDRKAKGGLLSANEDIEFEALNERKRYFETHQQLPHLTHNEILEMIQY